MSEIPEARKDGILGRLLDEIQRENELFEEVIAFRRVKVVKFSLLIDTFNLFRHAQDGLAPVFSGGRQGAIGTNHKGKPSAAEYVSFAEVFLERICEEFEQRIVAETPNSISEHDLRNEIRKLIVEKMPPSQIPDAQTVLRFKRTVQLFGADFSKDYHVSKIEEQEKRAWKAQNALEIEKLKELKRRVIEDDAIILPYGVKDYKHYNLFLDALVGFVKKQKRTGFYKFYLENGLFKSHSEKAVDTSLAVKSISLAYEEPDEVQVFCIADTDFVPVFGKLEELGAQFFVFHVGNPERCPQEFQDLRASGRLISLRFAELCSHAVGELLFLFMGGDERSYVGENADYYRAEAEAIQRKEYEEYEMAERAREEEQWKRYEQEWFSANL